ncbi:MAG: lipid A biosynthesis lauroyl acyltransferase [Gammaproteobacteria bacterium]|nr:lipid A biosynthesis lauroyl acyltransferase [Gammaproteobacteria bacterium]
MTFKEKLALANPLYWPAWAIIALLWFIIHLPERWQMSIGHGIGRLLFLLGGKLKKTTYTNIQLCFPTLSKSEQDALIKNNFSSMGIGIIEAARAWWLPEKKLRPQFVIDGLEYAEQAFTQGKGIILISPHFTSLELVGRLLSMQYDFAVMYQPHKKAILAFIQEKFRSRHYSASIPNHRLRELLRVLEKNMAVWYAYDVDGGKKRSVFAPFFGIPTSSLTSVSRLAKMSGAAVMPIYFYREENAFRYRVVLSPPLENFPSMDDEKDATQLNALLETGIRKKPEQYVWQYKRFKTRPAGEKRLY